MNRALILAALLGLAASISVTGWTIPTDGSQMTIVDSEWLTLTF